MPSDIIQFPYSKKSGYAGMVLLLIFASLFGTTCVQNYIKHDILGTVIFGAFVLLVVALMVLMVITRLIPAFKGEVALQLDKDGAKDYIRNIILNWNDVEDISLRPGRSSAMLIFELKFDSDFGKRVFVSLRWVEGRDQEIFETVINYFDELMGNVRVDEEDI
jgi:hypothetical protein